MTFIGEKSAFSSYLYFSISSSSSNRIKGVKFTIKITKTQSTKQREK